MKNVKKLASLLLALLMVFSLTAAASAATVTNKTSHSYAAYRIFSGTQAENSVPLGDVKWGDDVSGDALLTALKGDSRFNVGTDHANIFASCTTALDVAEVLSAYPDKSDVAKAFANVAAQHLTTATATIADNATSVELPAGYYLLVDTSTPGQDDARNTALLQMTNRDITIEGKYSVPSVDKSVQDTDGSWGESADWGIGSDVPFKLEGTLPANYEDYEAYQYVFHDTLSAGLQLNGTFDETDPTEVLSGVTVQVGDTDIGSNFTITYTNHQLTVACNNLKAIPGLTKDSQIVVEYTAELLSTAVIGGAGNKNEVYLEYANDPNATGDGTTSNTKKDEVLVFTYELDVTKVDGKDDNTTLANAEFVLLSSDKTKAAKVSNGKLVEWVTVPAVVNGIISYSDGTKLTSGGDGKFVIAGLDAGGYYLRETKAPAGYNLLGNDIGITITATLDKSENNPLLTALEIIVREDKTGAVATESIGAVTTGIVSTFVENIAGARLPDTGGIGTTIFYIAGSVLVLTAAGLPVTRKRRKI